MSNTDDLRDTEYAFLLTEAETGITFAKMALDGRHAPDADIDTVARNTENAVRAYETICRFRDRVAGGKSIPAPPALQSLMSELRDCLVKLGALA